MANEVKKTSISLDEEIYNAIAKIAEEEERSFSQQAQYIFKEYIRKWKENRDK